MTAFTPGTRVLFSDTDPNCADPATCAHDGQEAVVTITSGLPGASIRFDDGYQTWADDVVLEVRT
jgi:hypothetical protein